MHAVGKEKGVSLVCDKVTQHGLFQLLLSSDESHVPLLAIDEMSGRFLIILDLDMHVKAKLFNISHKNAGKQLNNQFWMDLLYDLSYFGK